MKKLFLIITMITATLAASAQITGKVVDGNQSPLPYVTVVEFHAQDSTLLFSAITDENGVYELKKSKGENSFLRFSFTGYTTKFVKTQNNLVVTLEEDSEMIAAVEVNGEVPKTRVTADAFSTVIAGSVLAKSGSANDLLQRMPMLDGEDGSYEVFGKGSAKIYINGREMQDASELELMNSEDIQKVDIVTNPGARYPADVKAVIRITTKRPQGEGFSFNLRSSYTQSDYNADFFEQVNLNYRKGGLDLFSTISYSDNNNHVYQEIEQFNYLDTTWRQMNTLLSNSTGNNVNAIIGANYQINDNHYVGLKYNYKIDPYQSGSLSGTTSMWGDDELYDTWGTSTTYGQIVKSQTHNVNGYYSGKVGNLEMMADLTYLNSKAGETINSGEKSDIGDYEQDITSIDESDNELLAARLNFSYPIWKGKLNFGVEYNSTNRNQSFYTDYSVLDSYDIQISQDNANAFVEYGAMLPFGMLSVGLRYENLNSRYYEDDVLMEEQSKIYNQWLPSASIATQLGEFGVQLSYTAKTQRPSYSQLSSAMIYGNRFTIQGGNPYLTPSITHDVTLAASWKFLQAAAVYQDKRDAIIFWAEQLESDPKVTFISQENIDRLPTMILQVSAAPTIGVWTPQLSLLMMKQWHEINSVNGVLDMSKPIYVASLNNSFKLPKDFYLNVDGYYQTKGNTQNIYVSRGSYALNLSLRKDFFKGNLSVMLKANDVLNSRVDAYTVLNEAMTMETVNWYDGRSFQLTLRYTFNAANDRYKGRGAGAEEINRL